jgi:hypothetical protein
VYPAVKAPRIPRLGGLAVTIAIDSVIRGAIG